MGRQRCQRCPPLSRAKRCLIWDRSCSAAAIGDAWWRGTWRRGSWRRGAWHRGSAGCLDWNPWNGFRWTRSHWDRSNVWRVKVDRPVARESQRVADAAGEGLGGAATSTSCCAAALTGARSAGPAPDPAEATGGGRQQPVHLRIVPLCDPQASDNLLLAYVLRDLLPELGQRPGGQAEEEHARERTGGSSHQVPAAEVSGEVAEERHRATGQGRRSEGLQPHFAENAEQPANPVRAPRRALQIRLRGGCEASAGRDRLDLHLGWRLASLRGARLQVLPRRGVPRGPARGLRQRGERAQSRSFADPAAVRAFAETGCRSARRGAVWREGRFRRKAVGIRRQERQCRRRRCRGCHCPEAARTGGARGTCW
mmetsp:Transcript_101837/g.270967  ORF Transcript_101837/g.270967 Transcript_101837/m.270967 type:complete len:368 (+) Transcript_101837:905-2008(+)